MRFEFTENSKVLKDESNKMYKNLFDNIKKHKYWIEKYEEKVYTGKSFDEDGYLTLLLNMNNPSQYEADILKRSFTKNVYKTIEKERNKAINIGEIVYSKTPSWSEIVSFYGGYSEINKLALP